MFQPLLQLSKHLFTHQRPISVCPQPPRSASGGTTSPSRSKMPTKTTPAMAKPKKGLKQSPVPEESEQGETSPHTYQEKSSILKNSLTDWLTDRKFSEDDGARKEQDPDQVKGLRIVCLKCNEVFKTVEERSLHIKTSPLHVCCQMCEGMVEFEGFLGLYLHIKYHHPHLLICNRCDHPCATVEEHSIDNATSPPGFCCRNCDHVVEVKSTFSLCSQYKACHSVWYCHACKHHCKSVGDSGVHVKTSPIHYCCRLCDDVEFDSSFTLRMHYKNCHPLVYCCACDMIFESIEARKTHIRTSLKHHCCQHCEDVRDFEDGNGLRSHYKLRHPSLCCRVCNLLFPTVDKSLAHMKDSHNFCDGCHQSSTSAAHRKTCEKSNPPKKKEGPKSHRKMKTLGNIYEKLGIIPDSSHEQTVQAAKEMRIKVHPDRLKRVGGLTEEQERAIDREAALVGQAADVLSDPVLRRKYDMKLI